MASMSPYSVLKDMANVLTPPGSSSVLATRRRTRSMTAALNSLTSPLTSICASPYRGHASLSNTVAYGSPTPTHQTIPKDKMVEGILIENHVNNSDNLTVEQNVASPSRKRRSQTKQGGKPPKVPQLTNPKSPSCARRKKAMHEWSPESHCSENSNQSMKSPSSQNGKQKPFLRTTGSREQPHEIPSKKFKSTAELLNEFHSRTPDRFRSNPKGKPSSASKPRSPCVTIPQSPCLRTRQRDRGPQVPTPAEREEMELKAIKEQQFKAQPLNKRILSGPVGIKARPPQPVTEPIDMKFATDSRIEHHHERLQKETVESPKEKRKAHHPVDVNAPVFKPVLEHRATKTQPFSFESKDEEMKRRRIEHLKEMEEHEKKLRQFKAQPLPPSPEPLPEKHTVCPTQPEPFHLRVDDRGAIHQSKLRRKIEREQTEQAEQTIIKARPAEVLRLKPFIPKKSDLPVTEPMDIKLASTERAAQREKYEEYKHEREQEARKLAEEAERRRAEQEVEELAKLRAELVVKPQPIKKYKPIIIKPSDKPLTKPLAPSFSM